MYQQINWSLLQRESERRELLREATQLCFVSLQAMQNSKFAFGRNAFQDDGGPVVSHDPWDPHIFLIHFLLCFLSLSFYLHQSSPIFQLISRHKFMLYLTEKLTKCFSNKHLIHIILGKICGTSSRWILVDPIYLRAFNGWMQL